jgi:hypothetical protein
MLVSYIYIYTHKTQAQMEDNIKMDPQEVGLGGGGMDWTDLLQDRDRRRELVNAIMNLRVPYDEGNFLTS